MPRFLEASMSTAAHSARHHPHTLDNISEVSSYESHSARDPSMSGRSCIPKATMPMPRRLNHKKTLESLNGYASSGSEYTPSHSESASTCGDDDEQSEESSPSSSPPSVGIVRGDVEVEIEAPQSAHGRDEADLDRMRQSLRLSRSGGAINKGSLTDESIIRQSNLTSDTSSEEDPFIFDDAKHSPSSSLTPTARLPANNTIPDQMKDRRISEVPSKEQLPRSVSHEDLKAGSSPRISSLTFRRSVSSIGTRESVLLGSPRPLPLTPLASLPSSSTATTSSPPVTTAITTSESSGRGRSASNSSAGRPLPTVPTTTNGQNISVRPHSVAPSIAPSIADPVAIDLLPPQPLRIKTRPLPKTPSINLQLLSPTTPGSALPQAAGPSSQSMDSDARGLVRKKSSTSLKRSHSRSSQSRDRSRSRHHERERERSRDRLPGERRQLPDPIPAMLKHKKSFSSIIPDSDELVNILNDVDGWDAVSIVSSKRLSIESKSSGGKGGSRRASVASTTAKRRSVRRSTIRSLRGVLAIQIDDSERLKVVDEPESVTSPMSMGLGRFREGGSLFPLPPQDDKMDVTEYQGTKSRKESERRDNERRKDHLEWEIMREKEMEKQRAVLRDKTMKKDHDACSTRSKTRTLNQMFVLPPIKHQSAFRVSGFSVGPVCTPQSATFSTFTAELGPKVQQPSIAKHPYALGASSDEGDEDEDVGMSEESFGRVSLKQSKDLWEDIDDDMLDAEETGLNMLRPRVHIVNLNSSATRRPSTSSAYFSNIQQQLDQNPYPYTRTAAPKAKELERRPSTTSRISLSSGPSTMSKPSYSDLRRPSTSPGYISTGPSTLKTSAVSVSSRGRSGSNASLYIGEKPPSRSGYAVPQASSRSTDRPSTSPTSIRSQPSVNSLVSKAASTRSRERSNSGSSSIASTKSAPQLFNYHPPNHTKQPHGHGHKHGHGYQQVVQNNGLGVIEEVPTPTIPQKVRPITASRPSTSAGTPVKLPSEILLMNAAEQRAKVIERHRLRVQEEEKEREKEKRRRSRILGGVFFKSVPDYALAAKASKRTKGILPIGQTRLVVNANHVRYPLVGEIPAAYAYGGMGRAL